MATHAVAAGHVLRNGKKLSPSTALARGDVLDILRNRLPYRLIVINFPARRGPAKEAQACYDEDSEVIDMRATIENELRRDRRQMPTTDGRPDKHTRRLLRSRNRSSSE